jgi:hypothetical protein
MVSPMASTHEEIASYYRSGEVRARIEEYCRTSLYLAGYGGRDHLHSREGSPVLVPRAELRSLLHAGADVCRSLADEEGLLFHLDVDYLNPLFPAEPVTWSTGPFDQLEPVYRTVVEILGHYGIEPLVLLSGRGYHFVARVRSGTPLWNGIVEIGNIGAPLHAKYAALRPAVPAAIEMGRAHEGAGRLLEWLAHEVIRRCRAATGGRVALSDFDRPDRRPSLCLDLSEYGDPLFERWTRTAFSSHQKRAPVVMLPRQGRPLADVLAARSDLAVASRWATDVRAEVTDVPARATRWLADYRSGPLAEFHAEFDRGRHEDPERWADTYDRLDLNELPECAADPLRHPNPGLLRPAQLRVVALALWGLGWEPRRIAGLIRSKYERDHGWGAHFYRYDAAARADFYVRLFCGAARVGLEDHTTFSCAVEGRRGACSRPRCGHDLARLIVAARSRPGVAV